MRTQSSSQVAYAATPFLTPGFRGIKIEDPNNPETLWTQLLRKLGVTAAMSCGVVFGSPRLDCAGTGICKLETAFRKANSSRNPRKNCRSSRGFLVALENNGAPALLLPEAFICPRVWRTQLNESVLRLESACAIPADMCGKLGLKKNCLPSGLYALRRMHGFILIQF